MQNTCKKDNLTDTIIQLGAAVIDCQKTTTEINYKLYGDTNPTPKDPTPSPPPNIQLMLFDIYDRVRSLREELYRINDGL